MAAKTIVSAGEDEGGIVPSEVGQGMAEKLTSLKVGKDPNKRVVGVLVGATNHTLGADKQIIYEMHSIRPKA